MNKLIREQLNQCRVAQIPYIKDDQYEILITKRDSSSASCATLTLNKCYLVSIDAEYFNSELYRITTDNWNKSNELKHDCLKIIPTQFLSNMVKIDSVAFDFANQKDLNSVYLGYWVPISVIKIISEI